MVSLVSPMAGNFCKRWMEGLVEQGGRWWCRLQAALRTAGPPAGPEP
jgi:hypothetical protein